MFFCLIADQFGGSLDNRKRLLFEALRSVRNATGPKFAVGVKLNSADFQRGGFTEEESTTVIGESNIFVVFSISQLTDYFEFCQNNWLPTSRLLWISWRFLAVAMKRV
jgi:2,4-dienoyl-CoA reductase-like NADH-dependent reductase (Old Yellow Enzyme family)